MKGELLSTAAPAANGAATAIPPSSDPLAHYIEGLEGELAPLTARRAQLEAELSEVAVQERRITEALVILRGKPPAAKKRDTYRDWTPSQKTMDDIFACLATAGEPLSKREIMERTGLSDGKVSKVLQRMRGESRIRLVGIAPGKGQAHLYEPMPDE